MVRQPGQVSYYILYDVLYPVNNTISGQWSREHGGAPESRRHGRLRLPEQPQGLQLDGGVLRGQGDDDDDDEMMMMMLKMMMIMMIMMMVMK